MSVRSKRITALFIAFVLLFIVEAVCETYADSTFAFANIPVKCKIASGIPGNHKFVYEMKASNDISKMPEGSEDGIKRVTVTESGKISFGTITFDHPERYDYTIREVTPGFKYFRKDPQIYRVTVYADTDGEVFTIIRNRDGEKPDEILFKNSYNKPKPKKKPTSRTGDSLKYIIIGGIGILCIILLLYVIIKRANTNDKEKIKEFQN